MKYLVLAFGVPVEREEEEIGISKHANLWGVTDSIGGKSIKVRTWEGSIFVVPFENVWVLAEIPVDIEPFAVTKNKIIQMLLPQILCSFGEKIWALTLLRKISRGPG